MLLIGLKISLAIIILIFIILFSVFIYLDTQGKHIGWKGYLICTSVFIILIGGISYAIYKIEPKYVKVNFYLNQEDRVLLSEILIGLHKEGIYDYDQIVDDISDNKVNLKKTDKFDKFMDSLVSIENAKELYIKLNQNTYVNLTDEENKTLDEIMSLPTLNVQFLINLRKGIFKLNADKEIDEIAKKIGSNKDLFEKFSKIINHQSPIIDKKTKMIKKLI